MTISKIYFIQEKVGLTVTNNQPLNRLTRPNYRWQFKPNNFPMDKGVKWWLLTAQEEDL